MKKLTATRLKTIKKSAFVLSRPHPTLYSTSDCHVLLSSIVCSGCILQGGPEKTDP